MFNELKPPIDSEMSLFDFTVGILECKFKGLQCCVCTLLSVLDSISDRRTAVTV
jgi:hypothetical protein